MTNEQIAELRALAEKATPGPWQHHCSHVYGPDPGRDLVGQFRNGPWLVSDRDLIVALRNNLPTILTALEALPVCGRRWRHDYENARGKIVIVCDDGCSAFVALATDNDGILHAEDATPLDAGTLRGSMWMPIPDDYPLYFMEVSDDPNG